MNKRSVLTLEQILSRPRKCEADWLVVQARDLALIAEPSNNASVLIFACLEARNAIEQLWFEILMVIYSGSIEFDLFEKCRRRRDGFLAQINDAEPQYRKLSRFTHLVMNQERRAPVRAIAWDLGRLKKLWQKLSNYCHAQAHSEATIDDEKWIASGFSLVHATYDYFEASMTGGATALLKPKNMKHNAYLIWEDFRDDKISEDQVKIRLKLTQPL